MARCSGGEGLYITSTFFLGPVLALTGWGLAQLWGTLWPTGAAVVTRSAFEPPVPQPPQAAGGFGLDSLDKNREARAATR